VITGAQLKGRTISWLRVREKHQLKAKQDFVPYSFSAQDRRAALSCLPATASPPANFITTTTPLDVKDKIVVVLRYEPPSFGEKTARRAEPMPRRIRS